MTETFDRKTHLKLKIAIVVHGRFNAFDLTRALIKTGHDVVLFTNYPKWAVKRFGIDPSSVRSFWLHGVLFKTMYWFNDKFKISCLEELFHRWFGQWASLMLMREPWDLIVCWSGISEEILNSCNDARTVVAVVRESSHINVQSHIMLTEQERSDTAIGCPSAWIIERENREYQKAKFIWVASKFVYDSFIQEKVAAEKVMLIPWATPTDKFRPRNEVVERRCQRILKGDRLRLLYVGAISHRKGLWDLRTIVRSLDRSLFEFRLVGPLPSESKKLVADIQDYVWLDGKYPQQDLPAVYEWGDLFIFPTLEDGYPAVLAQAYASALPILTTTNCSGPDLIKEGETGWILPIRSPEVFVDRLQWCDTHRPDLVHMVRRIYSDFHPRRWSDVACDIERFYENRIGSHRP
jgi:glycosyltransferase involved in cell wall biosynthesis